MRKPSSFILLFMLLLSTELFSQQTESGNWNTLSFSTRFKKWNLSSEAEMRSTGPWSQLNRLSWNVEATYPILKHIRLGAGYTLINQYDAKYSDYQLRQRLTGFAAGKVNWGDFSLQTRQKFQYTSKDESDRIQSNGEIDTYKINPEWTWRSKFKLSWNIPGVQLTPSASFESFYQLNNPDGNTFDGLRYMLSLEYKLTRHHRLELNGILDQEIHVTSPLKTYVLGFGYEFSF